MIFLASAVLAAATPIVADGTPIQSRDALLAEVIIQRTTIIRVPALTSTFVPRPLKWKEKKGPKCISLASLAGAAITRPDSVDLMLRGGARLRAKLEQSCPSLDFYQGFYVKPSKDGQVCQSRDTIHSRTGGECGIDKFKLLVPDK
jgi:hypothetical protein